MLILFRLILRAERGAIDDEVGEAFTVCGGEA